MKNYENKMEMVIKAVEEIKKTQGNLIELEETVLEKCGEKAQDKLDRAYNKVKYLEESWKYLKDVLSDQDLTIVRNRIKNPNFENDILNLYFDINSKVMMSIRLQQQYYQYLYFTMSEDLTASDITESNRKITLEGMTKYWTDELVEKFVSQAEDIFQNIIESLRKVNEKYLQKIIDIKEKASIFLAEEDIVELVYSAFSESKEVKKSIEDNNIKLSIDGENYKVILEKE